jgi:hypothetical protein
LRLRLGDLEGGEKALSDRGQLLVVTLTELAGRYPATALLLIVAADAGDQADAVSGRLASAIVDAGVEPGRVVLEKLAETSKGSARGGASLAADQLLILFSFDTNSASPPAPPKVESSP